MNESQVAELVKYSKDKNTTVVIRYCSDQIALTKPATLFLSAPSLRKIANSDKLQNPGMVAKSIFLRLLSSLNVAAFGNATNKYMSEDQCADLAGILFDDYGDLNYNELAYIGKKIKKGDYGNFYGNYSSMFICNAFNSYRTERAKYMANKDREELQQKLASIEKINGLAGLLEYKKNKLLKIEDQESAEAELLKAEITIIENFK